MQYSGTGGLPSGIHLRGSLDFNGLGIECHELARILKTEAHLFLDEGYIFGSAGEGFERWNLAAPTSYVAAALERMKVLKNHMKS